MMEKIGRMLKKKNLRKASPEIEKERKFHFLDRTFVKHEVEEGIHHGVFDPN